MDCWEKLGLNETIDLQLIRTYYDQKTSMLDPELDKEQYEELTKAYNLAVDIAQQNQQKKKSKARTQNIMVIVLLALIFARYLLTHHVDPNAASSHYSINYAAAPTLVIDPNSSVFQKIGSEDLDSVTSPMYYSVTISDYMMLPVVTNDNGNTQGPVVDTHVLTTGDNDYDGYELLGKIDSTYIILVVDLEEYMKLVSKTDENIQVAGIFFDTTPDMTQQVDAFLKQISSPATYYKDKYLKVLY